MAITPVEDAGEGLSCLISWSLTARQVAEYAPSFFASLENVAETVGDD